jgi:hypothetical protein
VHRGVGQMLTGPEGRRYKLCVIVSKFASEHK